MASLTSSANVPRPQTVYVPQTTTTTSASTVNTNTTSAKEELEQASDERRENLLARDRSRSGTIATSLQGLLAEREGQEKRKTLLGE